MKFKFRGIQETPKQSIKVTIGSYTSDIDGNTSLSIYYNHIRTIVLTGDGSIIMAPIEPGEKYYLEERGVKFEGNKLKVFL